MVGLKKVVVVFFSEMVIIIGVSVVVFIYRFSVFVIVEIVKLRCGFVGSMWDCGRMGFFVLV